MMWRFRRTHLTWILWSRTEGQMFHSGSAVASMEFGRFGGASLRLRQLCHVGVLGSVGTFDFQTSKADFHFWFQIQTHLTRDFSLPVTRGKPLRASPTCILYEPHSLASLVPSHAFVFKKRKEWLSKAGFFTLFHQRCQGKYCCGLCQFWIILLRIKVSLWLLFKGLRCAANFPVLWSRQSEGQEARNVTCEYGRRLRSGSVRAVFPPADWVPCLCSWFRPRCAEHSLLGWADRLFRATLSPAASSSEAGKPLHVAF